MCVSVCLSVCLCVCVAHSPKGRETAWQYMKENFEKFRQTFQGGFLFPRVIQVMVKSPLYPPNLLLLLFLLLLQLIVTGFIGEDKAKEVEQFFKDNPVPVADRVIKQSVEKIRTNTSWLERDREAMKKWLQEQVSD